MVGASDPGKKSTGVRSLDPLEPPVRPLELCDLCETARVVYVPGSVQVPYRTTIQVPVPPFDGGRNGQDTKFGLDAVFCNVDLSLRKQYCACSAPAEDQEQDALADRVCGAFCADARRHANSLLVDALLRGAGNTRTSLHVPVAGDVWGAEAYVSCALGALYRNPGLQFPLDFVCVLPSSRLADLLVAPAAKSALSRPDGKTCVNVAGLDFVAYGPAITDPDTAQDRLQPAFVMPRHGILGLAISDITVKAKLDSGRLNFDGRYLVGVDVLRPDGIVVMLPAASSGA